MTTSHRLRILVVEDDPDLSFLYEAFLTSEGHEVLVALDADQALHGLGALPDLILLDLMIPGGDGYSLLRVIRGDPATRAIPVIVISAAIPPGREHITGADAVVRKPFEFEGLLRTIDGVVHHAVAQH